jgi:hypothetical protein
MSVQIKRFLQELGTGIKGIGNVTMDCFFNESGNRREPLIAKYLSSSSLSTIGPAMRREQRSMVKGESAVTPLGLFLDFLLLPKGGNDRS